MALSIRRTSAKKTESLGKAMQEYNPDASWRKAEDEPAQTASAQ
jgi:hypothetical protein